MDTNEAEELGGAYVLTVDELGCPGLWDSVKEVSLYVCVCVSLSADVVAMVADAGAHECNAL